MPLGKNRKCGKQQRLLPAISAKAGVAKLEVGASPKLDPENPEADKEEFWHAKQSITVDKERLMPSQSAEVPHAS